ncbi:MAG: barstar family protein [Candidatus Obscuribacterales bacterium]|nr:barstar family protein [Candidatus Obscuribacterales bacterium]
MLQSSWQTVAFILQIHTGLKHGGCHIRKITIDCADVRTEEEFWNLYLLCVKPEGANYFGRNLNAFRDAVTAGGPGWPGECVLKFTNMGNIKTFRDGAFYEALKAIAQDCTEISIALE